MHMGYAHELSAHRCQRRVLILELELLVGRTTNNGCSELNSGPLQ